MLSVTWLRSFLILSPCLLATAVFLGNFFPHSYKDSIGINLGLDLQGGVHLLLEVDTDQLIPNYMAKLARDLKLDLRRKYRKSVKAEVSGHSLVITVPSSVDKMAEAISNFASSRSEGFTSEFVLTRGKGKTLSLTLSDAKQKSLVENAVDQSVEIVRRRVDFTGVSEPNIQRQGTNRIMLQLPGYSDASRVKGLLGQVAKLDLHMVNEVAATKGIGESGDGTVWADQRGGGFLQIPIFSDVEVAGEDIEDAKVLQEGGRPIVTFTLNAAGATAFARASRRNVGKRMAIVLDGEVVSSPVITVPILDGRASIEGNFTFEEATNLAITLRSGALPAPMNFLEERTVGPDLGADSVEAGKLGGIVALLLVICFITFYYRIFGIIASLVLVINVTSIFGILSLFKATITLPGIAGIVLTIGMAVDASILIFERIKEELALGRTPFNAMEVGYKQALRAIWDSNVTTGIVAFILVMLATGPVQGFGLTLGIGIVTSVYTATLVTRLLMSMFWKWCKPKNFNKTLGVFS